jgi:hypothetical protein
MAVAGRSEGEVSDASHDSPDSRTSPQGPLPLEQRGVSEGVDLKVPATSGPKDCPE